jgi:hypothetical protein
VERPLLRLKPRGRGRGRPRAGDAAPPTRDPAPGPTTGSPTHVR